MLRPCKVLRKASGCAATILQHVSTVLQLAYHMQGHSTSRGDTSICMPAATVLTGFLFVLQATQSIKKQRISAAGKAIADPEHHDVHHTRKDVKKANTTTGCGSCYGAETAQLTCCNTCEDVSVAC